MCNTFGMLYGLEKVNYFWVLCLFASNFFELLVYNSVSADVSLTKGDESSDLMLRGSCRR